MHARPSRVAVRLALTAFDFTASIRAVIASLAAGSDSTASEDAARTSRSAASCCRCRSSLRCSTSARAAVSSLGAAALPRAPERPVRRSNSGTSTVGPARQDGTRGSPSSSASPCSLHQLWSPSAARNNAGAMSLRAHALARASALARDVAVPVEVCSRRRFACIPGRARTSRRAKRCARPLSGSHPGQASPRPVPP